MANAHAPSRVDLISRLNSWLVAPLSPWWCVLGWCVATALFVYIVALLGGPSILDARESAYGTWAVAHGRAACVYPPGSPFGYLPIGPVYILLSGGIAAITRIGHAVAFPTAAALGPGCDKAFLALNPWSVQAGALRPTTWIGCVGWLVLMAGVVAWLRASGRGRCGWEPATVVLIACLPPVWMCVQSYFHPQDLLALGFALCALACARRGRWIGVGILIALAVLSQPFALLVAAPLLLLAPVNRRVPYAVATLGTALAVVVPLGLLTSGRALRAVTLGTEDGFGPKDTLLGELHLHGASFVLLERVAPVVISLILAWWVSRRLGPAALHPVALMSVVAVSLGLRLVFEQNLLGYYFMALAVLLVLLDVVRGRLRSSVVAWLVAVALVFCVRQGLSFEFVRGGGSIEKYGPVLVLAAALAVVLLGLLRGRSRRNLLPWLGVAACVLLTWPGHDDPLHHPLVSWPWQIALVVPGIVLAAGPLLAELRLGEATPHLERIETVPRVE
jgi:hypothetical protein